MPPQGRALVVFTRSPRAEARAKGLSPEKSEGVFRALLLSWKRAAESARARLVISSPPKCVARLQGSRLLHGAAFLTQPACGFNGRLTSTVEEIFSLGFSSVIVVPGDTPAIGGFELEGAFAALETRDAPAVVGPSKDGGVYLVGLKGGDTRFLDAISLRNPRTCENFARALRQGGRTVLFLARRGELDSLGDLQRARRSSRTSPIWEKYESLLAEALRPDFRTASNSDLSPGFPPSAAIPARAPPAA